MAHTLVAREAPAFEENATVNGDIKKVRLSDFSGKYLVLFFYPTDFTYVCPTEIVGFNRQLKDFNDIDCEVVGCSCDSQFSHLAWMSAPKSTIGHVNYTLLADTDHAVAKAYKVLNEATGTAMRALFIIDGQQKIRHVTINDSKVGRSVSEVLRLVKAFQYVDKHGEVCPADWQPGSDTIIPTTEQSINYFSRQYSDTKIHIYHF
uniref:thioredoxin-dependent peroxiredoxin n=1 Tax=Plectus sambesii TaxID=2011161 RepID=A0A914UHZ5_9BILA